MREIKEGEYFAPKSKEEYGFILKSLRDLGYEVYKDTSINDYDACPIIIQYLGEFIDTIVSDSDLKTKITLSDLFTEEAFETGARVLVRNNASSMWELKLYDRKIDSENPHLCIGGSFNFCIDYDTNKDKHGKV